MAEKTWSEKNSKKNALYIETHCFCCVAFSVALRFLLRCFSVCFGIQLRCLSAVVIFSCVVFLLSNIPATAVLLCLVDFLLR